MNGDGLPDLLLKNPQSSTLQVRFNRSGSLAPGQVAFLSEPEKALTVPTWSSTPEPPELSGISSLLFQMFSDVLNEAPDTLNVTNSSVTTWSGGAEVTYIFVKGGVSFSYAHGANATQVGFYDVNGDGLADRVLRSGREQDGALQVQENLFGGANLLQTVHRPLGGRIVLDYEQQTPTENDPNARWLLVVATLEHEDTFPAGYRTASISQQFEYENPFYDRIEREFYGFATVRSLRGDGRIAETTYANRDYRTRGLVLSTRIRGAQGELYIETENAYEPSPSPIMGVLPRVDQECLQKLPMPLRNLFNGTTLAANQTPCDAWFVKPTSVTTRRYEGGSMPKVTVLHFEVYDDFGNAIQTRDEQDAGTEDDLVALITYEHEERGEFRRAHMVRAHMVDRVHSLDVRQSDANGRRLRFRRGVYDEQGNLIKQEVFAEPSGDQIELIELTYDETGFVTTIADASAYRVTYTPDEATHLFTVRSEDSFGLTSTAEYDYGLQLPTVVVDANGQRQETRYDPFGRIREVTGPYELAAGQDSLTVTYTDPGAWTNEPVQATTTNVAVVPGSSGPSSQIRTMIWVDGLGRTLQSQLDAEVDGVVGRVARTRRSAGMTRDNCGHPSARTAVRSHATSTTAMASAHASRRRPC